MKIAESKRANSTINQFNDIKETSFWTFEVINLQNAKRLIGIAGRNQNYLLMRVRIFKKNDAKILTKTERQKNCRQGKYILTKQPDIVNHHGQYKQAKYFKRIAKRLGRAEKKLDTYFFSDTFISIELRDAENFIYVDWKGYQTESSVMTGCEKMLEALQQFNFSKVLNDNTNVLGIWTPAAKWVGESWFPRMQQAGLKHFAWVYSPSRMSQVLTDVAIEATPVPQVIHTFYYIDEAKQWLKGG